MNTDQLTIAFAVMAEERDCAGLCALPYGSEWQLRTILHEREDGGSLVAAHPCGVLDWFRIGVWPSPDAIRVRYGRVSGYGR